MEIRERQVGSFLNFTCVLPANHGQVKWMPVVTLVPFLLSPGTSIGVSSILLGLILAGRAAFVFPLSFLSNLTKKSPENKIELKQQV